MKKHAKHWRDLGISEKIRLIVVSSLAVAVSVVLLVFSTAGLYQITINELWAPIAQEHYAAMVGLPAAAILAGPLILWIFVFPGNILGNGFGLVVLLQDTLKLRCSWMPMQMATEEVWMRSSHQLVRGSPRVGPVLQ